MFGLRLIMSEEKFGPCPHCGGKSNGMHGYTAPPTTQCEDCGGYWTFGPGIQILDGKQSKKKRPGMYFRFCHIGDFGRHLREPTIGKKVDETNNTLCGQEAVQDLFGPLTEAAIMDDSTCKDCQNKFVEMTT